MANQEPYFWTVKEAASFLRISYGGFRYLMAKSAETDDPMPYTRVHNIIRIPRAKFIKWFESRSEKCSV